jgi:hypothetical protein
MQSHAIRKLQFAVILVSAVGISTPSFAQCAGCGADNNKADREKIEAPETKTEKEIRDGMPRDLNPGERSIDTKRVGEPNGSTADKSGPPKE